MDFDGCVDCGFKCEHVCPVSRGVKKYYLRAFLKYHLSGHEPVAWPCMNCHACDAICPGEKSPRMLVHEAMQEFLKDHENLLSDYRKEFLERGRIGVSSVLIDNLVLPDKISSNYSFLKNFDRVVIFPGCVVSSRFPEQVYHMFQVLGLLGVDLRRVIVEDELCCGSFLDQIDSAMFSANAMRVFKRVVDKARRVLVLTLCGSCTATLREYKDRILAGLKPSKVCGAIAATAIMHYVELLSLPETRMLLRSLLIPVENPSTHVYLQYPCQAETDMKSRKVQVKGLGELLGMLGYVMTGIDDDLGCCGSSLLDTHPDIAIEYGIYRTTNIMDKSKDPIDQVVIACGNCYRLHVDFRPSMDVEMDSTEGAPARFQFLLDLVMDRVPGQARVKQHPVVDREPQP